MKNLFIQLSENLHDNTLPLVAYLQQIFEGWENFMIAVSTVLDPKYVFCIYAPIIFALNKAVGHRFILALTLTEWLNQILKWILAGDRPYWYVRERSQQIDTNNFNNMLNKAFEGLNYSSNSNSHNYNKFDRLVIEQFPVTCELGAGSPSGHAMVTATVWYVLIDAIIKGELSIFSRVQQHQQTNNELKNKISTPALVVRKISWTGYIGILLLVSLSRVYLACHFPHQCLCGAILGVLIARFVIDKVDFGLLNKWYFITLAITMLTTALSTVAYLKSNGFNPDWSVVKGRKWCIKEEYLHIDTTPFFSMTRYLGFCLGTGLAFDSSKVLASHKRISSYKFVLNPLLLVQRLATGGLSIYLGSLLLALPIPRDNLTLFYPMSFVVYVIFSYSSAKLVPKITKQLTKKCLQKIKENKLKVY